MKQGYQKLCSATLKAGPRLEEVRRHFSKTSKVTYHFFSFALNWVINFSM